MPRRRRTRAAVAGAAGRLLNALVLIAVLVTAVLVGPAATASAAGTDAGPSSAPNGGYVPVGTKIAGTTSAASGPLLAQPGQYLDTLARGSADTGTSGSVRYYTVTLRRNELAYFSATLITPQQPTGDSDAQLDLSVFDLNQSSACTLSDDDFELENGDLVAPLSVAVSTAAMSGTDWTDQCPASGTFVVKVARSGDAYQHQALPLELGYHVEPPADTANQPPADLPASAASARPIGATRAVTGGTSFDNAPAVTSGRYQDVIASGQTRYFRIHLSWGQRFAFLLSSSDVSSTGAYATAAVTNPVRDPAGLAESSNSVSSVDFGSDGASPLDGSTAAAVRYANRSSEHDAVVAYSIDGDYFLRVSLGFGDKDARLRVPYALVLTVFGTPEAGPSYAPSRLPGADRPDGSGRGASAGWIALGAGVLLLGGIVAVLLIARRRRSSARPTDPGAATTAAVPARGPQRQR